MLIYGANVSEWDKQGHSKKAKLDRSIKYPTIFSAIRHDDYLKEIGGLSQRP